MSGGTLHIHAKNMENSSQEKKKIKTNEKWIREGPITSRVPHMKEKSIPAQHKQYARLRDVGLEPKAYNYWVSSENPLNAADPNTQQRRPAKSEIRKKGAVLRCCSDFLQMRKLGGIK